MEFGAPKFAALGAPSVRSAASSSSPRCSAQLSPTARSRAAATSSNGRSRTSERRSRRPTLARLEPGATLCLRRRGERAPGPRWPRRSSPWRRNARRKPRRAAPARSSSTRRPRPEPTRSAFPAKAGSTSSRTDGSSSPLPSPARWTARALRKSVKFPLEAKPLTIQLSDVKTPEISLIVSPE